MNPIEQKARDLAPHLVGLVIPGTYREEVILTLIQCADEISKLDTKCGNMIRTAGHAIETLMEVTDEAMK